MRTKHRGVTLVEVLVVSVIFSVLTGVLVPAIAGGRRAAQKTACAATQGEYVAMSMSWSLGNRDRIPGVNTTGDHYLRNRSARLQMLFDTHSDMPTSTFDWISPVMGASRGLSSNRARRTKQIFEELGCASSAHENAKLWGRAPDKADDFQALLDNEGIGQISYLAPASFHLVGHKVSGKRWGWRGPAITPKKYKPRIDRVGVQLSAKIFVADGTRYVSSTGALDFDVSPSPRYFGSFTSSTPIYDASTAYGQRPHNPEFGAERHETRATYPRNRNLSYRHNLTINAAYFDGHVSSLTEEESKRDAAPWFPSGSEFTGIRATEESLQYHFIGETLH